MFLPDSVTQRLNPWLESSKGWYILWQEGILSSKCSRTHSDRDSFLFFPIITPALPRTANAQYSHLKQIHYTYTSTLGARSTDPENLRPSDAARSWSQAEVLILPYLIEE